MSRLTKNQNYTYVLVEQPNSPNRYWTTNHQFSVHMNDQVVFGRINGSMYPGKVIRRTSILPTIDPFDERLYGLHHGYLILATRNQFPVADHPVQPELPVVPNSIQIHEVTKTIEDSIIKLRMLIPNGN